MGKLIVQENEEASEGMILTVLVQQEVIEESPHELLGDTK